MEPTVRPSPGGSRLVLTGRPPLAALHMHAAYPGKRHPAFHLLHLQKVAARGLHHQQQQRHHYTSSQASLSSDVTTGSEDVSMDDDDDDVNWDDTTFQGTSFPFPASPVSSRSSHPTGRSTLRSAQPTSHWDSQDVTSADYDIIFHRPAVTSTPCRRRHPAGRQSHHHQQRTRQPLPTCSFSSQRALQGSDVSTMTSPPSPQQQQFRYVQQRLPEVVPTQKQQQLLPRHSTPLGQRRLAGPRRSPTTRKLSHRYVMEDNDIMTSSTVESGYSSHGDPLSGSDQALNQPSRHYVTSCDSSEYMTSDSESHSGMMTYQSGMMSHSDIRYQSRMTSQSSMMTSQSDMMTYHSGMMTSQSAMMTYQSGMMTSNSAMTYSSSMTSQSGMMASQSEYPSSDDSELTLGEETLESLSQAEQEAYADNLATYFRSSEALPSGRNDTKNKPGRSVPSVRGADTSVFSTASDATDFMQKPTDRKLPVTARAQAPQNDRRKAIARCLKKMGRRLKLTGKHGSELQTLAIV